MSIQQGFNGRTLFQSPDLEIWLAFLSVSLASVLYAIYNRYFHALAKVPGPYWASITPLWLAYQSYKQRRPRLDINLHKRYGSVVRIRPNEVLFSNPEYFKAVHGAGSKFAKGAFYQALTDGVDEWSKLDMVAESNLEKLRLQKRHAGTVFSIANVKKHEDLIDTCIESWFKRLREHAGEVLDFNHELNLLLVDNQTQITFGQNYGAIAKGSDDDNATNLGKMWAWWAWTGQIPWLTKFDKRFAPWRKTFSTQNWDPLPVMSFTKSKIMEIIEAPKDAKRPPGVFDDLLGISEAQPKFLPTWAAGLAATNMGAGIDTTSWTLATVVAMIAQDNRVFQKVNAEIQAAKDSGEITLNTPVTYDAAVKLTYLQACINEAMRMLPSVDPLVRVVPAGGMSMDGFRLPEGTEVTISARVLGRSEDVFGSDPDEFRPERWLEANKEKLNDMNARNLSFGGLSRKCPGMHLAWVGMSKMLASFFLNFNVELLNELDGAPGPGGRIWREYGKFVTIWHGMEVRVTPRSSI